MNPEALATLSDISAALCVVFILLIPIAGAGLSLINTGLGRSRSGAHMMWCSLCAISISALVYFVCGFAWQGAVGEPGYSFIIAAKEWNWIAAEPLLLRGPGLVGSPVWLSALFGMFGAGLASLIPLGAGADRWRLGAVCLSTCLLAGFTFPLFAHWVWAGGWLAQLGANYGLGSGFLDSGGSGAIQAAGGLTALSMAWILGPRRGKYSRERMPSAIPGHSGVLVLLGCFLALGGWLGLNCAGALLFSGIDPSLAPLVAVNTFLSASSSALVAAAVTRLKFGKPDASLTANGWIAGLVASSAGCALMVPAGAVATGLVAGLIVTLAIEMLEVKLLVDDPGGAISVHAVGGPGEFSPWRFSRVFQIPAAGSGWRNWWGLQPW